MLVYPVLLPTKRFFFSCWAIVFNLKLMQIFWKHCVLLKGVFDIIGECLWSRWEFWRIYILYSVNSWYFGYMLTTFLTSLWQELSYPTLCFESHNKVLLVIISYWVVQHLRTLVFSGYDFVPIKYSLWTPSLCPFLILIIMTVVSVSKRTALHM